MIHKVGQINRKSWDRRRKRRNSDRFESDHFIPVDRSIVCFVFSSSSCCVVANFTSASFSTKRRNFVISKWVLRRCEMSNSIFQRWRGYWCRSRKDAWSPARWWISLFSIQNCFFLSFSKSFLNPILQISYRRETTSHFRFDYTYTHICFGSPTKETEYLVLLILFIIGCYSVFSLVIVFIYK